MGVAQLVEPWIVIPVVVGSSPIVHPKAYSLVTPAKAQTRLLIYVYTHDDSKRYVQTSIFSGCAYKKSLCLAFYLMHIEKQGYGDIFPSNELNIICYSDRQTL